MKTMNYYLSTDKVVLSDYRLKKFNSFKCQRHLSNQDILKKNYYYKQQNGN